MFERILALFSVLALLLLAVWVSERIDAGSIPAEANEPLSDGFRTAYVAPPVNEEDPPVMGPLGESEALGDSIWGFDCQGPPDDNQCIGIEFDGHYFYITGGGGTNHPHPNKLHFFDRDGNYIGSVDQPTTSYWGWKDIAYDGYHMYSSEGRAVDEWYVTGLPDSPVLHVVGSFPGPEDPNCAMAYDPATDHFWTAYYWGTYIYEFDRSGAVINQYPSIYSIYGMAWDTICPDGPWLWVSAQAAPSMVHQFDPYSGSYTGVSFPASGIAGGCSFSEDWHADYCVLFYLAQSYPDRVIAYEMCPKPPPSSGLVTGGGWIPADYSGEKRIFGFNVHSEVGAVWGQLQFNDHALKMRVHSDTVRTLVVQPGDTIANFSGECRVDGVSGYTFDCEVMDRGEPGHHVDWFSIDISGPGSFSYSAGDFLGGGNIQIHTSGDDIAKGELESEVEPGYDPNPLLKMDEKAQRLAIGQGLSQNSPNPFTDRTTIRFTLPASSHITLRVYDTSGRIVAALVDAKLSAGAHSVTWEKKDVASGVYFCKLTSGNLSATRKLVLLR